MQSKATTVDEYLATLPPDRRKAVSEVRDLILDNIDDGFEEVMQYGMIGYCVPHRIFPAGYHCDPKQPLPYAGLASQKNYMSLYLMMVSGDEGLWTWFNEAWAKTGKKLDMGKCCIRFKNVEDLALDVIAGSIRRVPVKKYVEGYQKALKTMASVKSAKKPTAAKKVAKTTSKKAPAKSAKKK